MFTMKNMTLKNVTRPALAVLALSLVACGGSSTDTQEPAPLPTDRTASANDGEIVADSKAGVSGGSDTNTPADTMPDTPTGDDGTITDADIDRGLVLLQALAKAVSDHKGDCDKAATALNGVLDANQALLDKMKKVNTDPGTAKRWRAKHGNKGDAISMALVSDLEDCKDRAGVKAFFKRLQ